MVYIWYSMRELVWDVIHYYCACSWSTY